MRRRKQGKESTKESKQIIAQTPIIFQNVGQVLPSLQYFMACPLESKLSIF